MDKARGLLCGVAVGLVVLTAGVAALGQREKVAVFVQAGAPVPSADLEILKGYANQRCAAIGSVDVASPGELMYAQRATKSYVSNSLSPEGISKLAQTLDLDHIVVFRIVRWEDDITFRPERSLLLLGVTSFLDTSLKFLISPLGLLFGLDKEAVVSLFATVFGPSGEIEFTTAVTYADRPLFSLLTADPLEAGRQAIEAALYQLAVVL